MSIWMVRAWLAQDTPRLFAANGRDGTAWAWLHDLEHTVRWWVRWGAWSPPTRRVTTHGSRWPAPKGWTR